jgi:flagellar basal-body rod protein FlgB
VPAKLFELLSGWAAWLAERQGVLSRNVANADTPGFRPLDLAPASFEQLLRHGSGPAMPAVAMARTAVGHLAGSATAAPAAGASFRPVKAGSYEVAPSGNAVVLPEQLQKMAQTELDYQLTTNLYRRFLGMTRTALGVPAG